MMIRPVGVLLAAALLVSALLAGRSAQAEETPVWLEKSSEGLVSVAYGPVDPAETPLFLLSCFNAMGIAVLDVHKEIPDAKPGEPVTIELSAGEAKTSIKGEAARDDASGVTFGEASDIAVKPILEVLRAAGPLTIAMGKTSATLSEQGREQAVAKFSQDCRLD
jgi:hypothetical protein